MIKKDNSNYNKIYNFVNSFDIADYIITNYPKPLYLTQLLSILYFYQIAGYSSRKTVPFEDPIKVKNNFIYIEDINRKYKNHKKDDLKKLPSILIPYAFHDAMGRLVFMKKLINYCRCQDEEEIMDIVRSTYLFKLTAQAYKKTINFRNYKRSLKEIQMFGENNAILPFFL